VAGQQGPKWKLHVPKKQEFDLSWHEYFNSVMHASSVQFSVPVVIRVKEEQTLIFIAMHY